MPKYKITSYDAFSDDLGADVFEIEAEKPLLAIKKLIDFNELLESTHTIKVQEIN